MAQQKVLTIVTLRVWAQIMLQKKRIWVKTSLFLSNFSLHVVDIEANMSHPKRLSHGLYFGSAIWNLL